MIVELPEDIGIKNIRDFYLNLKELIEEEKEIIFDFKNVRNIDLSVAQMIISLGKELVGRGDGLELKSTENISKQLLLAGINNYTGGRHEICSCD